MVPISTIAGISLIFRGLRGAWRGHGGSAFAEIRSHLHDSLQTATIQRDGRHLFGRAAANRRDTSPNASNRSDRTVYEYRDAMRAVVA